MNSLFLAAPLTSGPPPAQAQPDPLTVALESLDGTRRIPLDGSTGWWRLDGTSGLEMPPMDVVTSSVPGVFGSVLRDVRVAERPVGLPMFTASESGRIGHLEMLDEIRSLVDPLTGEFLIVATTTRSERQLRVVYTGGLEGAGGRSETGIYWRKFGLTAVACDPFAYDRSERLVPFDLGSSDAAFLGAAGGTDKPWPRMLSSSAVIGSGMQIEVRSEVPVFPTLEIDGPVDSFTGTMSTGWSVSIPGGVADGSTLRLVTDPRARSIRLDGAPAAGLVARGSTLRPFYPGVNVLDVVAPGGSAATRVRLSWREAHRSLW